MSGPKKWVSSKVHRKTSSRSSICSYQSASSPLDDTHRGVPPSPPIHLPKEDAETAATAVLEFSSGSTLMTSGGLDGACSQSSLESGSTGLSQSPSTTPPKKAWEKNYKSFLKRSGKHTNKGSQIPIKPLPRMHLHSVNKPSRTLSENAVVSKQHHSLTATNQNNNVSLEDLGPSLADGFEKHSRNRSPSAANDNRLTAPASPSKHKELSSRGSAFFKRMRSKTKSVDNLDASMRRGLDRKSPTNTPPHSASSTPIPKSSPLVTPTTAMQEGMEKAALLSELLFPPKLSNSASLGSPRLGLVAPRGISSQGDLNDDSLDQARHRGHSVSMAPSTTLSPKSTNNTNNSTANTKPTLFSRVQSMGSNLIIPEGEPATLCLQQQQQSTEDELRERRKAFTDFHNMGVDSSSAYLGDESSLHRHSMFLSSMAYPAGSAGGKPNSQRHTTVGIGGYSLDQKRGANISPSTSMGSISQTKPPSQHAKEAAAAGELTPERALRSLKGPEHWTKGERHAIIPGVLCMCPIQVLNNIMSKEEQEQMAPASSTPSLTARGSQRGYGIGSIISEDEGLDSNGWFFADHHQQPVPRHAGGISGGGHSSNAVQLSAFGKVLLGKATVAPLGMRSFLNEIYGWSTGVFILRQNYLFEYREGDNLNGLPWGYAHLPLAEAYPHKHFSNALHLDFFERPCTKSGKRSLLLRVESKSERDRWVSMLQSAARMTMHDLYDVDESEGAPEFGQGRYAVVRPAKRRDLSTRSRSVSFSSETRYPQHHTSHSQESFRNVSSYDSLGGGGCSNAKLSNTDLEGTTAAQSEYTCALKIIDKAEFWSRVKKGRERADTLVREAAVQTTLAVQAGDAPGFLRLRNIFETGEKLVLELELLKGTDLFQHVSSRGVLDEVEAAYIMRDLLTCLNVLDQVGIAHRDIKPANLLMCHDSDDSKNNGGAKIKVADYGMASFVGVDNLVRGRCGTPGYVAPEILLTRINGGYSNKVDMFSAGVTLYVMLAGYEPFYGESDAELIDANREAKVDFPHADWHKVSIEGRDLVERMLIADPSKRIGPSEALRHPWITRRATAAYDDCGSQKAICSIS